MKNSDNLFRGAGLFDLVALVVIASLGLFTAYVTFGILDSQAETNIQKYSVSGALAGALIAWSLLASVYMQFRKASGEVQKLRERIEELQYKLLRGAPCPMGFESEIDERHRIVLARPQSWTEKEGVLFNLVSHEVTTKSTDIFPIQFRVFYDTIKGESDPEAHYKMIIKEWETNPLMINPISEYIFIGGEQKPVKSLKIATKYYVRFELTYKHPISGKTEWEYHMISEDDYNENKDKPIEGSDKKVEYLEIVRIYVSCYHPEVKGIIAFDLRDNAEDFTKTSALFNQILNSVRLLT